jgi:hypothetical protein
VLYVGARTNRFDFGEEFRKAGSEVTILEIFQKNVEHLRTIPWLKEVIHGDVRDFQTDQRFDVVFWWHGPEHLEQEEIQPALERLEAICDRLMVIGCPWGHAEQHDIFGNPHEEHLSHLDYPLFENLGYQVECIGRKGLPWSAIVAIKKSAR